MPVAPFDGDQMNLWAPWSPASRAEAQIMSSVHNWFISTKSSGPVNGQVHDSVVGSFLLTRSDVRMDKYHAMRLFAGTRLEPPSFASAGPEAGRAVRFSGREVVSRLLEAAPVSYDRPPSWFNEIFAPYVKYRPDETRTRIEAGRLVEGVLDKRSVGAGARGGIFHLVSRKFGPRRALEMVFALQQMAIAYLGNRGFTIGTADMVVAPDRLGRVRQIISELLAEADRGTAQLVAGELLPPIGSTTHQFYEKVQKEALRNPDSIFEPILESIDPDTNGLFQMIATGARGKNPNMIHIMGLIGQILINTQRILPQFSFGRTLINFPRFAVAPAAYGFVANSYISGMTSSEAVLAGMAGRFDLITKALSTASTGYQNRKAVMSLQSMVVDNYLRVPLETRVIQYLYGDDGIDPRQVETVPFRTVELSDERLEAEFRYAPPAAAPPEAAAVFEAEFRRLREDRDFYRMVFLRLESVDFKSPFSASRQMPVNVAAIVGGIRDAAAAGGSAAAPPPTPVAEVLEMHRWVEELCETLPYTLLNESMERRRAPIPAHVSSSTSLLQMLVRIELCSRVLAGLTPEQLGFALIEIRRQFSASLIDPGSAAGILAAQAISEPLTQYMLDSHHRSVAGGTNKSGIVRPLEIFGAKTVKQEQSPEMLLRLRPEAARSRARAEEVANNIELMELQRFVREWDLLYEPEGLARTLYPGFANDIEWIREFQRDHPLLPPPDDLTRLCARFSLDKTFMVLKGMSLERVVGRLRARFPLAYLAHSPENARDPALRVYFRAGQFKRQAPDESRALAVVAQLLATPIRGIPGIRNAGVVQIVRHRVGPGGELVKDTGVFAVQTTGTNLYGAALCPEVDARAMVSSSIGDTLEMFGIEAARQKIISEIRGFMGDSPPNIRHLALYADVMTRSGRIVSLEKGGVNSREHSNVFLRMATSSPVQVLQEAVMGGMRAPVYGISAPLMLGSVPAIGTHYNTLVVDEGFVQANTKSVDAILDDLLP